LFKKPENLHELLILVYYVVKRVSSDSKKVMMHNAGRDSTSSRDQNCGRDSTSGCDQGYLAQLLIDAGKGPLFINKVINKKTAYLQHERPRRIVVELLPVYHQVPGLMLHGSLLFLRKTIKRSVNCGP
jgi:hypothetical protein